jgi:hypothetical protein
MKGFVFGQINHEYTTHQIGRYNGEKFILQKRRGEKSAAKLQIYNLPFATLNRKCLVLVVNVAR